MKRQITPHKGGRTVKKSTDVTPVVASMLEVLYTQHSISLGDIVEEATIEKFQDVADGYVFCPVCNRPTKLNADSASGDLCLKCWGELHGENP